MASIKNDFMAIARGDVAGHKMYSVPGRKDSVSATVLDDLTQIPGNTITPSPDGMTVQVVSSTGSDNSTGTGIRTIDLHFLDSNGLEQQEIITLNGTGAALSASTDVAYIQWMHAQSVGSSGVAAGGISLQSTDGATTYEYIEAGGNQSLSGRYKVPSNKTGYVIGWQVSAITKKIDIRLRATVERFDRSLLPGVFLFQDIAVLQDVTSGYIPFPVPLRMPAGAIVKMSGLSEASGGDAGGQFDIMVVDG